MYDDQTNIKSKKHRKKNKKKSFKHFLFKNLFIIFFILLFLCIIFLSYRAYTFRLLAKEMFNNMPSYILDSNNNVIARNRHSEEIGKM